MHATTFVLLMATMLGPPAETSPERSTRIYVRTTPPGASIVVDGKELGTSDGLFLVPPGVRTVTLEMDGYDPEAKRVDVREGWITRVEVTMKRGGTKPQGAGATASKSGSLYFVRWVIQDEKTMTFEGAPVTLDQLPSLLEKVPNRAQTVLEMGYSTEISVKLRDEYLARAGALAHKLGFKHASDIGQQKLGSKGSPPQEVQTTYKATRRKIHLPDADTKDASVVLDLASGEMLKLPWESEDTSAAPHETDQDTRHFTKLGIGDLAFDRQLFCLRGGTIELAAEDAGQTLRMTGKKDDAKAYQLPKLPCELLVTTPEKRQFVVKILDETPAGGLNLEYRQVEGTAKQQADSTEPHPDAGPRDLEGFAPERTLRIYDDFSKAASLVDLDTGELHGQPAREEVEGMTGEQWMASKGIDAGCETNAAAPGLWGMDMVVLPVSNDAWEKARVEAIEGELRDGKPGSPAIMSALGGLPRTYYFATREGGKGILQITAQTKDEQGEAFEIRYRLTSQSVKSQPAKAQTVPEGGVLDFRIAASEEEGKTFAETGKGLGWYDASPWMNDTAGLVTRQTEGRTQILLWQTAEKSLAASHRDEKKWHIVEVSVIAELDQPGRLGVVFDVEGGRRLRELTAANIDRRLAVVVDEHVVGCPVVRSPIGERVEITGSFSKADLARLATALQAGMEAKQP